MSDGKALCQTLVVTHTPTTMIVPVYVNDTPVRTVTVSPVPVSAGPGVSSFINR